MPAVGSRLGPYEIVARLGAGGMGEVFRARDTRLDRSVALKVLPAAWAHDPDRLRRFEQEARAVGALSHPNLLTLFDVGTADGVPYVVTELLEGDTLRERMRDGALPVRKAVDIACQLARGLAAAHERGIVHRDLKPENVFITRDGHVKILDFGLARLAQSPAAAPVAADGETRLASDAGTVVGTAGYLSPEQARGASVDGRTDIFSLGAVLYEMLSGRRAFGGATAVDAISAVVRDDPPELTGSSLSPALVHVVRRCLEKQPGERYQSARDVGFALEAVTSASGIEPASPGPRRPTMRWALVAAALAAAAGIGAVAARWFAEPTSSASPILRYESHSGMDWAPSVSPDGKTMAFASSRDGTARIWLKQLIGSSEAALTTGPDNYPRFHPDGASVLFVRREGSQEVLYRQPLLGGEARRLVQDVREADWSPDGRRIAIMRRGVENGTPRSALLVCAADGSQLRQIAAVSAIVAHPRWSPDGTQVAATETGFQSGTSRRVFVFSVADGATRVLETPLVRRRLSSPVWTADGRSVIYLQAESVTADTSGSAGRVFRQDVSSGATRMLLWSPMQGEIADIVADGSLVWDGLSLRVNVQLLPLVNGASRNVQWLTRGQSGDRQPVFTRDGQWVIFSSDRSGNLDLWAVAPASGMTRRLTDDAADDWDPGVTHDGRLLWSSTRSGHFEVWMANADGSGARQVSSDGVDAENPTATPDGWIVYSSGNPDKRGIWKVKVDGTGAQRLAETTALVPDVSPDGRYVAATVQTYDAEVRIRVWRVSDGALVPFEIVFPAERPTFAVGRTRWMPDGRRLAFIGLNDRGQRGVYVQDFVPGRDTTDTRRPLGGFDTENRADSFAISPDGGVMAVAGSDMLRTILRADGIPGIVRPAHAGP